MELLEYPLSVVSVYSQIDLFSVTSFFLLWLPVTQADCGTDRFSFSLFLHLWLTAPESKSLHCALLCPVVVLFQLAHRMTALSFKSGHHVYLNSKSMWFMLISCFCITLASWHMLSRRHQCDNNTPVSSGQWYPLQLFSKVNLLHMFLIRYFLY